MNEKRQRVVSFAVSFLAIGLLAAPAFAQTVTYKPYIQPGDNGPFGARRSLPGS